MFCVCFFTAQCKRLTFGEKNRFVVADSRNDVLGKGAFGTVYRAIDMTNGIEVAVKTERTSNESTLPTEIENYKRIGPNRE